MLDRGLLTINDGDPQQNFLSRINREPTSMGRKEFNSNVCELIKLPQIKIEQGLMKSTLQDEDDDENVQDEEDDNDNDNEKEKQKIDTTPSILKTSLLAGAAATLASLSAAPIKLQVKRLAPKKNIALLSATTSTANMESNRLYLTAAATSKTTTTTTSFLQTALLATDKSNNPATKFNNLNVTTKFISKKEQEQHAFKPALTLATLSEIASARKQQMELEEQQQQQEQQKELLVKQKTLDKADKATLSQNVLKLCSCNAAITNATQLLAFKPLTATATATNENFNNNKYQASSTQTIKIPTIRTATATTQTQTDELLDTTTTMTKTTTTTTELINNAILPKTAFYNNTKQLLKETGAKSKALITTTNTTTPSSQHKIKMTAVSLCKEHVTHVTPSLPLSTTTTIIQQQQQQKLILLTQKQSSSMIPALIPSSSSSSLQQQPQQQEQHIHNRHRQQQQQQQLQLDAATANGAVTVVVFKTMLPDD